MIADMLKNIPVWHWLNKNLYRLPEIIRIEASSACQLKCPACPTAKGEVGRSQAGTGYLKFDDFKKLIDRNTWISRIELSNWGEVFLNPDLLKIFEYAYYKGVAIQIYNGANLNTLKEEVIKGLVQYKVRGINCSIDGASQETYSQYRVNGNFDQVIENIRKINYHKQKMQRKLPHLNWQFIIFKHNEHEIEIARDMAAQLGMSISFKQSWDANLAPERPGSKAQKGKTQSNPATTHTYNEIAEARSIQIKKNDLTTAYCHQLWSTPQINYNGDVLGCCVNFWGSFGNVADNGWNVRDVLWNEKIHRTKRALEGSGEILTDPPCATCHTYKLSLKNPLIFPRTPQNTRSIMNFLRNVADIYGRARRKQLKINFRKKTKPTKKNPSHIQA